MLEEYKKYFPYESIRDEQRSAIEFALKSFDEGKRFVILELGTGCGKSGVGITLARKIYETAIEDKDTAKGAYFLTTQKVLQEQYASDFGKGKGGRLVSLKSSSNYTCKSHKESSCKDGQALLKKEDSSSSTFKTCNFNCPYKQEKEKFLTSPESITNFSYFLTAGAYATSIRKRQVLVIDEAHNIEPELSKFVEVVVSETFAKKVLKLDMPDISTQHQGVNWVRSVYFPKLLSHITHINMMLEKFSSIKEKIQDILVLSRQIELLNSHRQKIETFLDVYDKDNWVMNTVAPDGRALRKLEFKAIDISPFAEPNLFKFGEKIIMMSATILNRDSFCEQLGIKSEQAAFISIPSPFPVENRPILYVPVGKMNKSNIDTTMPKLIEAVRAILDNHPNEKGIIHAHTFKIAQALKNGLKSNRILTHNSANREEVLEKHFKSKKPSVLVSPSMTEGVDLKGDSSRFQIICKVPYPYLGDKLCKKRMSKWKWWYPTQTAKTIVQAIGRSIRSMNDHAVTYILDEDWNNFYGANKKIFPDSFRASLLQ